jgi:uncharacterized membrane protein
MNSTARIIGVVTLLVVSLMLAIPAAHEAGDCHRDDYPYGLSALGVGVAVAVAALLGMTIRLRWRVPSALAIGLLAVGVMYVWFGSSWLKNCAN